jgi:hypothetical protein
MRENMEIWRVRVPQEIRKFPANHPKGKPMSKQALLKNYNF